MTGPQIPDRTGWAEIRVAAPVPAGVLATLTHLIGEAWPGAVMTGTSAGTAAAYLVDPQALQELSPDQVRSTAGTVPHPEEDIDVLSAGPDGISVATPEDVAAALLPVITGAFEEFPEAENYLEIGITDPATWNRYVLTFSRSAGQTPHALREKAEVALRTARTEAHKANVAAVQRLLNTSADGSYSDGVRAALGVMRELNFGAAADPGED